ncbi:hypothetical protein SAMN05444159_7583 [Bradyrhizobium lablabi]|uniref:Uncharacterized protein n=1 Tax=Bradyrhizobium lablabi TaxID=722472 RepID=A0A1M7FRV0_9BRAD|nr:hypothetical protein [Bradyrhizobium lablabi]SHM06706.1 hypothetical protein SAMN05444159_7583 [Bradyrhizobium lablabi]
MSSAARKIDHHQSAKPSPIEVFRERARARAMLVANGLMDLQTAVDGMQETAGAQGLVAKYGQDEIQQILSEAFARWR